MFARGGGDGGSFIGETFVAEDGGTEGGGGGDFVGGGGGK